MKKGLMGLTGNWGKAGPSGKSSSRAMGSSGFTIGFTGGGVGIDIMPMSFPGIMGGMPDSSSPGIMGGIPDSSSPGIMGGIGGVPCHFTRSLTQFSAFFTTEETRLV